MAGCYRVGLLRTSASSCVAGRLVQKEMGSSWEHSTSAGEDLGGSLGRKYYMEHK